MRLAQERVVERDEHHVDALLREIDGDRLADPGARARDHRPVRLVPLLEVLHTAEVGEHLRDEVGEDVDGAPEGEEVEEGLLAARAPDVGENDVEHVALQVVPPGYAAIFTEFTPEA